MTGATRGTRQPVTGIVLAGGRSSRFGSDKLAAQLEGRSLLERAVEATASIATDLLVVSAPDDDRPLPAADISIRRVADPEAFGGPLVGLRAGLELATEPIVVVVGGDMPTMRPAVLSLLVLALTTRETTAAAVLAARGRLVPLPAALRTGAASDQVGRLVDDGERRLGSLFDRLPTRILEEGEWRPLDPAGDTIRDVDRPEDL